MNAIKSRYKNLFAGGLVAIATLTLAACTSHTVKTVNSVKAVNAVEEIPQWQLLDVSLVVFDPNVPENVDSRDDTPIYPDVRKAESLYIAYQLRKKLESTNQWGAVRVLPDADPSAELLVTGSINESDGVILSIDVTAVDTMGHVWLSHRYEELASQYAYRDDVDYEGDPFEDLYSQVANDLLEARNKMSIDEMERIRTVANLRYAADLSPAAFGKHLKTDKRGNLIVNRLPAPDDPMLSRVNRIRESEYLFVDTVDQQYANFHSSIDQSYDQWRRYAYEETMALRDIKRSSRARIAAGLLSAVAGGVAGNKIGGTAGNVVGSTAVLGGLALIKQGYDTGKEAKLHEEALKELATSFNAEVQPTVVQVEGEVIKLSGSLDAQYQEWRQLMRDIYAEETGFPVADESGGQ